MTFYPTSLIDQKGSNKGKCKDRLQRKKVKLGSIGAEPKPKGKKRIPTSKRAKKTFIPVEIENEEDEESAEERQVAEVGEEDLRERELAEDPTVDLDKKSADGRDDGAMALNG